MLLNLLIPLVNWNLGTGMIMFFGLVCIGLMLTVHSMINSGKNKNQDKGGENK
ncbi:hypothetical protein NE848_07850 [Gramella jeungdoensis]|uniref:DUF3149 domain-containing protein n=1 Tax=Gramella jeungdoensis TaxID=708091 RepID=A0ABT0Z0N3_9FLAO|nr:hypothetical protein [Gramella jeungdoensis]MCM8569288.1 hypothetical protein [Gramella jeungdoensis]